jgi:histidinol-phosphate aminotransferase
MLNRRNLFKMAAGAGAAAAVAPVLSHPLFASPEPRRFDAPQPGTPILLNSNENAYGPFPSVLAMSNPLSLANRYPFRQEEALVEKIARIHRVNRNQVLLGCGSSEIIKVAMSAFTGPSRRLVTAAPTYELAEIIAARATNTPIAKLPLTRNYAHDLAAMLPAAKDAGLVYMCNPNNPTGSLTPRSAIESFLAKAPKDTMILIDEAYHDFVPASADYKSFLDAPVNDERVIVARTFSKIHGMAGLRIGYGVAAPQVIAKMRSQGQTDSINIVALGCASLSLDDSAAHAQAAKRNTDDRDQFMCEATARKLSPIPAYTNFVMMDIRRPVRPVIEHFHQNGILVGRPFPPYDTHLRVSLGKPDEMIEFWRVWDGISRG